MTMKQEKRRIYLRAALALAALLLVLLALDNLSFVPSMLLTVLRKGAIYALVAVSMNLLNGFTGLFSLGQAGFMLLGAYTYAILTIPAASQKSIYQRYANGGIGFSIPELLSKPLGGFGLLLGVVFWAMMPTDIRLFKPTRLSGYSRKSFLILGISKYFFSRCSG